MTQVRSLPGSAPQEPAVTSPRSSKRGLYRTGAYAIFLVPALLVSFFTVSMTAGGLDDEGYIVLTLKGFMSGHSLYHDVFSQYGPFPYELWGAVGGIFGVSATPNAGAVSAIVLWLISSLLIGVTVERLTGNVAIGLIGAIFGFAGCVVYGNVPIHPQAIAATSIFAVMAVVTLLTRRTVLQMSILGFLLGQLVLTKINVGGSAVVATLLVLCVTSPPLRRRRWLAPAIVAACVMLPFVLMTRDLDQTWAQNFAVLISLGMAAIGVCLIRSPLARLMTAAQDGLLTLGVAFLATVVVIVGVIVVLGTSPGYALQSILIRPLAQPDVITVQASIPLLAVDFAVVGVACAVGSIALAHRRQTSLWPGLIRLAAAVLIWMWASGIWASGIFGGSAIPNPTALGVCIPLSWLALVPAPDPWEQPGPSFFTRGMLATLPVLGAIVAFPVAGDQMQLANVAFIPVGGLILGDGLRALTIWSRAAGERRAFRFTRVVPLATAAVLAVVTYQVLLQGAVSGGINYGKAKPLPFAGASMLRMPAAPRTQVIQVVHTLRANCDSFLSLPGMDSFYLWAHIPPPNYLNATTWMYLLNSSEQRRVVDAASHVRRLCLIRNPDLLGFWIYLAGSPPPNRSLWSFMQSYFKPIATVGPYQILIHGDLTR